jgi:hypothetical protein
MMVPTAATTAVTTTGAVMTTAAAVAGVVPTTTSVAASTVAAVTAMASDGRVVRADQGNTDDGEKHRHAQKYDSIHFCIPPFDSLLE